ncbi:MAG: serine/threonine protein kinase [Planctomycetes bacterium]|nr:serine/threonine protein kinase [Planctomycetota bacterium]
MSADPIADAIAEFQEAIFAGKHLDPAAFCADHPEAGPELAARLDNFLQVMSALAPDRTTEPPEETEAFALAGRTIGDYRIVRELGRGGMGVVYEAEQLSLQRRVALKLIRPENLGLRSTRERFHREALAASRLDHPGICPVFDVGDLEGMPYIAMRLLTGESLARCIERTRAHRGERAGVVDLPGAAGGGDSSPRSGESHGGRQRGLFTIVQLIEEVARALHAAHEAGLVHRDVKPGNVFVTPDGRPVLLDFGLARIEGTDAAPLTRTGDLLGTPAYMSPEQLQPKHGAPSDRRTDVYSLGVTLHECLTLRHPYASDSQERLYRRIRQGDATPVTRHAAIPRDLVAVLEKAMERDPRRRYPTTLAFAEDLRRVRTFEPVHARRAGPWLRTRRWTQRNPVAAGFLAVLSIGLVAVSWLSLVVQEKRREAEEALLEARITALRAESGRVMPTDPAKALRLAYEALILDVDVHPETVSQLQVAVASSHEVLPGIYPGHGVDIVRMSPEGEAFLVHVREAVPTPAFGIWRAVDGTWAERHFPSPLPRFVTQDLEFGPAGDWFAVAIGNGVRRYDLRGTPMGEALTLRAVLAGLEIDHLGRILTHLDNGSAVLWVPEAQHVRAAQTSQAACRRADTGVSRAARMAVTMRRPFPVSW